MFDAQEQEVKKVLKAKIDALPAALLTEVKDFVEFLASKRGESAEDGLTTPEAEEETIPRFESLEDVEEPKARPREARENEEKRTSDEALVQERYSFFKVLRDADLPGPKDASVTYEEKLYGPQGEDGG